MVDGSALDRWTRSQLLAHENPASLDRYEHLLPDELFEARAAQRLALGRYLDGSSSKVVAADDADRTPHLTTPEPTDIPKVEDLDHAFAELERLVKNHRLLLRGRLIRESAEGSAP